MSFYDEVSHREIVGSTEGKNLNIEVYFCVPVYFDLEMLQDHLSLLLAKLGLNGPVIFKREYNQCVSDADIISAKNALTEKNATLKKYIRPYIMNTVVHVVLSVMSNFTHEIKTMMCEIRVNTRFWKISSVKALELTDSAWILKLFGVSLPPPPEILKSPRDPSGYPRDNITFYTPERLEEGMVPSTETLELLIVGYFDREDGKDVLYITLLMNLLRKEWEFPSRELHRNGPIKCSNFTLLERDTFLTKEDVITHAHLAYFDRFKTHVSFILVGKSPSLAPSKRIGVPFNQLMEMSRDSLKISSYDGGTDRYGLKKVDQCILKNLIMSPKFSKVMTSMFQSRMKILPYSAAECGVCTELLVESKVLCSNGHVFCVRCSEIISAEDQAKCPMCRVPILHPGISNQLLDGFIMQEYPKEYEERLRSVSSGITSSFWLHHESCQGKKVNYEGK